MKREERKQLSPEELQQSEEGFQRFIEHLKANAPLRSFEGAVKSLEALCLRHAPERFTPPEPPESQEPPERFDPERTTAPERFSDGWYASEILIFIGFTRFNLEKGRPNHAAAEAFSAGVLAGDWPAAQQWRLQQEARRRGGQAPKHLASVQAEVDRLVTANPKATVRELWDLIPEGRDAGDGDSISGFSFYRDGSKIVQAVEDETGRREKAISFRSFGRYVTHARNK
jgi:hypothetical protein